MAHHISDGSVALQLDELHSCKAIQHAHHIVAFIMVARPSTICSLLCLLMIRCSTSLLAI